LRTLRIAAPVQPSLALPGDLSNATDRWWALPEHSRIEILVLLAHLIARGIVSEGEATK
jgi:hypothetical protein